VKEKRPDLVIPDLMMPRMHGFTVCQAVRGDPSLRHIANLATSAKSYPVDVARAHELGADYYPTKPYDIQVLLQYAARQGWGHRTWKDALESAQEADVTQLDLFHHDPGHDDATMDGTVSSAREYMDQRGMHF
jgi:CheY-like chemotaxis protein